MKKTKCKMENPHCPKTAKNQSEGIPLETLRRLFGVEGDTVEEILKTAIETRKKQSASMTQKDRELLKGKFLIRTDPKDIN